MEKRKRALVGEMLGIDRGMRGWPTKKCSMKRGGVSSTSLDHRSGGGL